MNPDFSVPAEFFYALAVNSPSMSASDQLTFAVTRSESQLYAQFLQAIDAGIIDPTPSGISPLQAARRLVGLGAARSIAPLYTIGPSSGPPSGQAELNVYNLIGATAPTESWLSDQGPLPPATLDTTTTDAALWQTLLAGGPPATANQQAQLRLVTCALTGWDGTQLDTFVSQLGSLLNVQNADDLANLTGAQWQQFFTAPGNASLLPAFTQPPGQTVSVTDRIEAFLRFLTQFYTVVPASGSVPEPAPGAVPLLDRYGFDPLQSFLAAYDAANPGTPYAFGTSSPADAAAQAAIAAVFPSPAASEAAAWLAGVLQALGDLAAVTSGLIPAASLNAAALEFSIMEGLYARGFTSKAQIAALDQADFASALTGSVAWQWAQQIWTNAGGTTGPTSPSPGPFQPVNACGTLADCIPPEELSPLGPVAYLSELLQAGPGSTCEQPVATGENFASLLATRRGSLASLQVTAANLETPLPAVDLVNECLENIAAQVVAGGGAAAAPSGAVYDTSGTQVGDHLLRPPGTPPEPGEPYHHDPATLFGAVAEYSSPASPVAQPSGYTALATDFSAPELPYSQPLDLERSYLRQAGSTRFETMRRLRAEITEFALAAPDPAGFDPAVWRYPVRSDIAPEYLHIGPQEYQLLYGTPIATSPPGGSGELLLWQMYGYPEPTLPSGQPWEQAVAVLGEFLRRTGLSYCEFLDLSQCGLIPFGRYTPPADTAVAVAAPGFDRCEPCCLDEVLIDFGTDAGQTLMQLAVFIRLWRKLQGVKCARYTICQLCDIASVLGLFQSGAVDPGFVAQLAAFQMLRDRFGLPLGSSDTPGATGADRTRLLGLWASATAPAAFAWATGELLSRLEAYARREHGCERRPELLTVLTANLDPLSVLGGFDPGNPPDTWHAAPTHTLRFAEILAKIYASPFRVGDIEFLCTTLPHLHGEDPFPLQPPGAADGQPLGLPAGLNSLWHLRRRLLEADVNEQDSERYDWWRIDSFLRAELGYDPPAGGYDPLLSLAQHSFPGVLERQGYPVPPSARHYHAPLSSSQTSSATWNADPDSPFRYDAGSGTGELLTRLPLPDEAVLDTLARAPQLDPAEQTAVQELYFQPRADLAALSFLFPDLAEADRELIQNGDERERWHYFRRHVALAHRRCGIIAEELARGADRDREPHEREVRRAHMVLKALAADENLATSPWEGGQPAGTPPALTWPEPAGGAYAALLGLCGTGLAGEYRDQAGALLWRDFAGPLSEFGHVRDQWNVPVPALIPSLATPATAAGYVDIRNGIAVAASNGERLGGAQGFTVTWAGVLLVDRGGHHRFSAGAPTPEGEHPDAGIARHDSWTVTLGRDQRTWVLLSHSWPGQADTHDTAEADLRDGAYDITISYQRAAPDFSHPDHLYRQKTGFQVKYAGPDTGDELISLPRHRLFTRSKDAPLGQGIDDRAAPAVAAALQARYVSTLRDIRRTYQRAVKAIMLVSGFGLEPRLGDDTQSELGYFLGNPGQFAGMSFYRDPPVSGGFTQHQAQLDLDFLPVLDDYDPPAASQDQRADPSPQRQAALFDWWERLFDYAALRRGNQRGNRPAVWWLFQASSELAPAAAAPLLPYLDVEPADVSLVQTYDGLAALLGRPELAAQDLLNERWAVRVWRAETWARQMDASGGYHGLAAASPVLWAADDPGAGSPSGNDDLVTFVQDALIENGDPRRYEDLRRLDDGLRERARSALLAFLCRMNRVPLPFQPSGTFAVSPRDLTDLLLLDVASGICERASRIDDAVSAVQAFVLRCLIGLEPGIGLGPAFRAVWEGEFASFRVWQACRRRELYPENWIEWDELEKARRHEAFRFLEENLRRPDLSIPVPAGIQYWQATWPPEHPGLPVLQASEPSTLHLPVPAASQPADAAVPTENFGLLGRPDWSGAPSWLAAVAAQPPGTGQSPPGTTQPGTTQPPPAGTAPPGTTVQTEVQAPATAATSARTARSRRQTSKSPPAAPDPPAAADLAPAAVQLPGQPQAGQPGTLPLWIEAAIRLGARFLRVAAAGEPAGSSLLQPPPEQACCCADCGRVHPPGIDEYYFWLAGAQFYDLPAAQDGDLFNASGESEWDDPTQFPKLLYWDAQPMVHLYWCRVRCGEFSQTRRSSQGVVLDPTLLGSPPAPPTLELRGRMADSLVFAVDGGVVPLSAGGTGSSAEPGGPAGSSYAWQPPYQNWTAETGWRYDLATDDAELLPLVVTPTAPSLLPASLPDPSSFGGLAAYPFFVYFGPGASLTPLSWYSPAVAVAGALRGHCRFDAALNWYALYYDAEQGDNAWCPCQDTTQPPPPNEPGQPAEPTAAVTAVASPPPPARAPGSACCCQNTPPTPPVARQRSVLLDTLETLLCWGDALMARHRGCSHDGGNAPESFAQARVIFDAAARILGRDPVTVLVADPAPPPQTVSGFQPLPPPLNPRLVALYQRVGDRLRLIRECGNRYRRRYGSLDRGMSYWGDDPVRDGWRTTTWRCCDPDHWCEPPSPYRFAFLIQRALDAAGEVESLGGELLSALEKGDAEILASLHATQEHQVLRLGLAAREDMYRDADWQVQALGQSLLSAQNQLAYYTGLVNGGLNSGESIYQDLMGVSIPLEVTGQVMELVAVLGGVIPDTYVGTTGLTVKIPMTGSSFGDFFTAMAKAASYAAQDAQAGAGLSLTEGGWDRRSAEWQHQIDIYNFQIEQIRREILGAERREDAALHDLNTAQRQIEGAAEVDDFLRSKFTSQGLYQIYQRHCAIMHRQHYELAVEWARQAEHAWNYERGHTAERFIDPELWNDLRQGLLAGERLRVALQRMNKAYLDRNKREYELTKNISLRLQAPEQYLRLRWTGRCEFELPEWLFDLDYPGQYMRRIKSVALSLPCVVGPYTGVHCRLTLLDSGTRVDPRLAGPAHGCCDETPECGCDETAHQCQCDRPGYLPLPGDPRIVREYLARDAIATSSGRADAGMFEVNFGDDRYLPFEYAGAVSRWRLELPPENNYFDLDTLTDVIVHLSYTAREGGDALRRAAADAARCHLPGDGIRLLDVRNEMPEYLQRGYHEPSWERGRRRDGPADSRERPDERGRDEHWADRGEHRPEGGDDHRPPRQPWHLDLRFSRSLFPYLPRRKDLDIRGVQLIFEAPDACPGRYRVLRLVRRASWQGGGGWQPGRDGCEVICVASDRWPGCYIGFIPEQAIRGEDSEVRPWIPADLGVLVFPEDLDDLGEVFLLLRYDEAGRNRCRAGLAPQPAPPGTGGEAAADE